LIRLPYTGHTPVVQSYDRCSTGSLDAYEAQDMKIIEPVGDDLDHFQSRWL